MARTVFTKREETPSRTGRISAPNTPCPPSTCPSESCFRRVGLFHLVARDRAMYGNIAGDWQINSILTGRAAVRSASLRPPAHGGTRPNAVGDPNIDSPMIDRWFNTAALAPVAPF